MVRDARRTRRSSRAHATPAIDFALAHRAEMRDAEGKQLTMRPRTELLGVDGMTLGELLRHAVGRDGEDDLAVAALDALGDELESIASRRTVIGCSREAIYGASRRARVAAEVMKRVRRADAGVP